MKQIAALIAFVLLAFSPLIVPACAAPATDQIAWRTFSTQRNLGATAEVKAIQFLLRDRGFYPSQPDGIYGAQTAAAVKKFQRSKGLIVDGIVGPQTWPKLVRVVRRGDRDDAVRAAQILLRELRGHSLQTPYKNMKVDGIFGAKTEAVTLDAQHLNNWFEKRGPQNGVFGMELWRAMTDGAAHP